MSAPASLSDPVFPPLQINPELVKGILVGFIENEVRKVGFDRVVLNLSGGVDSSLVAFLATEALGRDNVMALILPYKNSDPKSRSDALEVVAQLGIRHFEIDITPQIDAYFARFPEADHVRRGNKMARERMTIAYDHSLAWQALVIGTPGVNQDVHRSLVRFRGLGQSLLRPVDFRKVRENQPGLRMNRR